MKAFVRGALLASVVVMMSCAAGAPPGDEFRVALVTPGPVTDAGWNAAAFAGLQAIGDRFAAVTTHVEASGPGEFEEAFRDFASRGFALVVGHGFEFQDAAMTVGSDFPETAFLVTSGLAVRDNVAGLVFRLEEAAYLAGVMAAGVSESGVTGMVGGMDIPPVRLVFDGFRRGFTDARPDGLVKEVFLGSWEDAAGGRQATMALVEQGADVIIHNADAAGFGVFQACRESGVLAFGTNSDQASAAPDVVLASAVMDIPRAMVEVALDVKEGRFAGRVYAFDLRSGVVNLVVNENLDSEIPSAVHEAVAAASQRLRTGEVALKHFGD